MERLTEQRLGELEAMKAKEARASGAHGHDRCSPKKPEGNPMTPEQCRQKAEEIVRPYMSVDAHGPDYLAMVRAVMGLLYETAAVSESFSVIAEDQNCLCGGLNKILDAHGVEWDEETDYANAFSGIINRLTGERNSALAAEARKGLQQRWIPVSERLPQTQHMVLLHSPHSQRGTVQYGFYGFKGDSPRVSNWYVWTTGGWEAAEYTGDPVTHWQPLPEPPQALTDGGTGG